MPDFSQDQCSSPGFTAVAEAAKAAFLPLLRGAGISRLVIIYDGEGDEGQVHEINAFDGEGAIADLPQARCQRYRQHHTARMSVDVVLLEQALDSFAHEALGAYWSGWEDGSGACGEIEIDVATGATVLTHNSRFIDFDQTITEL